MPPRSTRAVTRIPLDDTESQPFAQSQSKARSRRPLRPARPSLCPPTADAEVASAEVVASGPSWQVGPSQEETYETLPERITVYAGVGPGTRPFSAERNLELYERAETALADSIVKGRVGDLRQLRRELKRKREAHPPLAAAHRVLPAKNDGRLDVLWYNATIDFPTTSSLQYHQRSWTPFIPPPLSSLLPTLPAQPRSLVPLVGTDIPPWSVGPVTDLDPIQDELLEFENRWHEAGGGWGMKSQDVYSEASIEDTRYTWSMTRGLSGVHTRDQDASQGLDTFGAKDQVFPPAGPSSPRRDNYATRAGDSEQRSIVGDVSTSNHAVSHAADQSEDRSNASHTLHEARGQSRWQGDSEEKERKRWWRAECSKTEGYGRVFSILPRPHTLLAKPRVAGQKRAAKPPDFVLPRYYSLAGSRHPFHPDLVSFLGAAPSSRVYWAIPICGPIAIRSYSDPCTGLAPPPKAPVPSAGVIVAHLPTGPSDARHTLRWSSELLRHFWTDFVVPLYADSTSPFGGISIMVSGPKPDPFLALRTAPPLPPRTAARTTGASDQGVPGAVLGAGPVRPEMGDHIRIYCHAKHALSLRTWLHSIEVDLDALGRDQSGTSVALPPDPTPRLYRVFDRTRLVLVGDRGEALVVA